MWFGLSTGTHAEAQSGPSTSPSRSPNTSVQYGLKPLPVRVEQKHGHSKLPVAGHVQRAPNTQHQGVGCHGCVSRHALLGRSGAHELRGAAALPCADHFLPCVQAPHTHAPTLTAPPLPLASTVLDTLNTTAATSATQPASDVTGTRRPAAAARCRVHAVRARALHPAMAQ